MDAIVHFPSIQIFFHFYHYLELFLNLKIFEKDPTHQ
jgi:hypothetical protein